ncbi:MAG TPA: glycosyltransferase, partial [Candidatus Saccharimonadales bacterium]|nr:glycosyltransferase [Candidatus Saccharimonadales bacterium]
KPIVFDELINFTEWLVEHRRLTEGSRPYRLFRRWNAWLVKRCRFILADTAAHAEYSSKLNMLSIDRYRVLPVCADETVFRPATTPAGPRQPFTVVYYGSMLALHGLEYVLRAAERLKDRPDIEFRLIGGKPAVAQACREAAEAGARVRHEQWVAFEKLPAIVAGAGLVLGGPFGGTLQSRFVVTGKTYQALAAAAPVLVGQNEVHDGFADKRNCLMVPQADPAALAAAVSWAAEHPAELAKIGPAGRQLYEERFSQAVVNGLMKDIIKAL